MSEEGNSPIINLIFQCIRDLSVENPRPFDIVNAKEQEIETDLSIDVQANALEEQVFEVIILSKIEIKKEGEKAFLLELQYSGIFNITNCKQEVVPFVLFVQCPHLLFPSIRHIIRNVTQDSGLPGLNLQSIDFLDLFKKKIEQQTDMEAESEL